MPPHNDYYDAIIVGSGVSGSFLARELCRAGWRCVMLEAGQSYGPATFPKNELDGNARLYWGGGVELDTRAGLALLRAKVVGGGSVVNQALVDRFDEKALASWRAKSGIAGFSTAAMDEWYARAEALIPMRTIPEAHWNRNARLFQEGFSKNGFRAAPLRRAQKDCRWEDGNDCIVCLNGCRLESKSSMPVTVLREALASGLELRAGFEVGWVEADGHGVRVRGRGPDGAEVSLHGGRLVLAAGSLGTTKLLLQSGFGARLPALGRGFHSHPQFMTFARYDEPVDAHRGPFQGLKSDDAGFRHQGFKLENVFAPPAAVALLLPRRGLEHLRAMKSLRHLACIEVAIRDTSPGRIRVSGGRMLVDKKMNAEDRRRRDAGQRAVETVFRSTGARELFTGTFPVSLHLMGGCAIGTDPKTSVVTPEYRLRGFPRIVIADSSIFPDAPGINPSLTIMALSLRAAEALVKEENGNVATSGPVAR